MKVVIDTNVLVSGIFFKGVPSKIVEHWLEGKFIVYATPLILEEYLRVIDDLSFRRESQLQHNWDEVLAEICQIIPDVKSHSKMCRDPGDDKFLLCAAHSGADYLVSGDLDLSELRPTFDFKIVFPRQFLEILISEE